MTISPFTVYLVLQADSIGSGVIATFAVPAATIAIGRIALLTGWADARKEEEKQWNARLDKIPGFKWAVVFACMAILAGSLFPSTKTLAGSFIAPAIINSSAVQKDLPELYDLGIAALKAALASKPEPKPARP